MASELAMTTAALAGVALLGASVGVGMTFFDPLAPSQGDHEVWEEDLETRVFFESTESVYDTSEYGFPVDGVLRFDPLRVDLLNVTYVVVTLHARMDGIALNEEFELTVQAPDNRSDSGSYSGPLVNVNGFDVNPRMINWKLALSPTDITYSTTDVDEALVRSAQNHTRTSMQGDWLATVDVGTPGVPGRSGNISLTYTFTHYEAVAALVDNSRPEPSCGDSEEAQGDDGAGDGDGDRGDDEDGDEARRGCPVEDPGQKEPEAAPGPVAERRVGPRTFITETPVARTVDRDPGPDGPL